MDERTGTARLTLYSKWRLNTVLTVILHRCYCRYIATYEATYMPPLSCTTTT